MSCDEKAVVFVAVVVAVVLEMAAVAAASSRMSLAGMRPWRCVAVAAVATVAAELLLFPETGTTEMDCCCSRDGFAVVDVGMVVVLGSW